MSSPTTTERPNEFFVRDVAEKFGKDPSRIRQLCLELGLGTLKYGRIRVLRKRDIARLKKYFEKSGRITKNDPTRLDAV